ncbi:MAG: hypothetical protein R3A48_28720 [Polyangiales bacterium]
MRAQPLEFDACFVALPPQHLRILHAAEDHPGHAARAARASSSASTRQ